MSNAKITYKITQGMYVLTTEEGGCMVDAVSQISGGDRPLIAVAVMKKNRTHELMRQHDRFALSVLGKDADPRIIKVFGLQSGRDADKFAQYPLQKENGLPIVSDSLGYMICEKIDAIENETHTLFIGRMTDGNVLRDEEPMSYGYYQAHKNELLAVTTEQGKTAWVCSVCGYVYYGDTLPVGFTCPVCGVGADRFEKKI